MNKQTLMQMWDHLRQCHGIAMRVIASLPADQLASHPIPNMRTPKELIVHLYGHIVREIPQGVVQGEIKPEDPKAIEGRIKSKDDLIRFVNECWSAGSKAAAAISDANLKATVKTPWGFDMPGVMCITVVNDEYFHHRGQLYAFLRQLGGEPLMMWDFEHNEAAYGPKASQTA